MRHKPDKENVPRKERKGGTTLQPCELVQRVLGLFYRIIEIIVLYQSKMTNRMRVLSY